MRSIGLNPTPTELCHMIHEIDTDLHPRDEIEDVSDVTFSSSTATATTSADQQAKDLLAAEKKKKKKVKQAKIDFAEFLAFLSRHSIPDHTDLDKEFEYFANGQEQITADTMLSKLKELGEPTDLDYYKNVVNDLFAQATLHGSQTQPGINLDGTFTYFATTNLY